jgi:hypothetical protein
MKTGMKITLGIAGAVVVIGVIASSCSKTPEAPPAPGSATAAVVPAAPPVAPVVAPPAATGPLKEVGDGTYEVGVDMTPGKYKTPGPDKTGFYPNCYWELNNKPGEEWNPRNVTNDNIQGPGVLTAKKGQNLKLSGGCTWDLVTS